ncbi:MAG: GNAT family N-acetyltransferase [Brevibacterium aurantiacum]|uniref:GNAT family N-acetyltransferase n=1 Tax=Brevibacterium aurantiacum TaxID=273384 RepID=A0A2H1KKR5_BREAU|nr:GNAT family N-acetyltransferase [Brevibacterium aurantiacum]MDN5593768.1 GNAT family N-acetyltransferase [Brevibacterium sp.]AZL10374.1 GNAT family N-acetyltransferase [Brevibacterium aurantiacum]AZL14058.1 GNAT family N-acetyltransferase [Brevibacterium aurantiacum]AZT98381.1 GNAT family N-acetyltransferase [Brevibacterium aurantiacum]MDN5607168.1 GNAT family N-acetyltransferase [Brevibacterium sp.]
MSTHAPATMVDAHTLILNETGFDVSELGPDDIDDYVALVASAYRGEPSKQGWTTEADLLSGQRLDADMAREMLAESDSSMILVRSAEGLAVGSVYLREPVDGTAYLGVLAVSPEGQGQGVGSALMNLAEAWVAERWNARWLRMSVINKRAELIAYYERRGYERTGEVEPFPYGDDRFGVPLVDDLEFVVLVKELR